MTAMRETCYVSNAGTAMSFPQKGIGRQVANAHGRGSGPVVLDGVTPVQGVPGKPDTGGKGLDIWADRKSCEQQYAVITSLKVEAAKMNWFQPDWNAGCAERCLSGVGRAGWNSTAEKQHGRCPSWARR